MGSQGCSSGAYLTSDKWQLPLASKELEKFRHPYIVIADTGSVCNADATKVRLMAQEPAIGRSGKPNEEKHKPGPAADFKAEQF